jgi:hypothetical protein
MNMNMLNELAKNNGRNGKFVMVRNEDVLAAAQKTMIQGALTTLALLSGFIAAIILVAKMF